MSEQHPGQPHPGNWGPPPPKSDPWGTPGQQPPPGHAPQGSNPATGRPGPQPGSGSGPQFPAYPGPGGPGGSTRPGGPSGPAGPGGPPAVKKKSNPKVIIGVAVGVTVLLIGGLIAGSVAANADSMEKGVSRYFEALGKTYSDELANHVVNVPTAAEVENARKLARTQDYTVTKVRTSGNVANVDYTVAGRAETVDLEMRKVDGKWKVVDGFGTVQIKSDQKGAEFSVGWDRTSVTDKAMVVYPGTYEINNSSDSSVSSYLWEADGDKYVSVKPGENKVITKKVKLTKNGEDRVRSALGSAFSRCTIGSDVAPRGCPFSVAEPGDRASAYGNWSVDGPSRFEVAQRATIAPGQPFDAVCGTFSATVNYEYRNANGYTKIPANKSDFTGCADMTQTSPTVTWK